MSQSAIPPAWQKCPCGQLANLVEQKAIKQRRQFLINSAAFGATVVGGFGLATLLSSGKAENKVIIRVTCTEAIDFMDEYFDKKLAADLVPKVDEHLKFCGHCRNAYDNFAADMA